MSFVITVPSEHTEDKEYTVRKAGDAWVCSCSDHVHRSNGEPYTCKHIAVIAKSIFAHVLGSAARSKAAKAVLELD